MANLLTSTEAPQVSIIIPCFNESPDNLEKSLNSVLRQTFQNFECIVIDESTNAKTIDRCLDICKTDVRFLYHRPTTRVGLAASLNMGISLAKGHLIARFDSDDICHPERLALQLQFLRDHPEIDVLGCSMLVINNLGEITGRRDYPQNHKAIEKKFIFSNAMAHPTIMFRKSTLNIAGGGYETSFKYCEDLELWLRLLKKNVKFANLPQPLVSYRQEVTTRDSRNWKYNIEARIKNLSSPYLLVKIIGIIGIAIWMYLPKKIQDFFYDIFQIKVI